MNWFKPVMSICFQNIRKWRYNYRVWIAIIIVAIFVHSYSKGLDDFCDFTGYKSSIWIYPFIYMQYYSKMLFFFPLVLLFCDAPFIDDNQHFVIIRSGRMKWCIGEIFYIVVTSGGYFFFVFFLTILFNIKSMYFDVEWGKVLNTIAKSDAFSRFGLQFRPNTVIINRLSPITATILTYLNSWLSGIIIGLLVYYLNMYKNSSVGTYLTSLLVVFSGFASKHKSLIKFSPIAWSTLDVINLYSDNSMPSFLYIYTVYFLLIILLIALCLRRAKKYQIL